MNQLVISLNINYYFIIKSLKIMSLYEILVKITFIVKRKLFYLEKFLDFMRNILILSIVSSIKIEKSLKKAETEYLTNQTGKLIEISLLDY